MRYLVAMLLVLAAGCDAMNLSQLRQALVEQSGQRGLVTDAGAGDYSDKSGLLTNATYYLNAGIRWLNQLWQHAATRRRAQVAVSEGDYVIDVPNVENINRMDYIDGDGQRQRVAYKPIEWLRDYFGEDFASVDQAKPVYWTWWDEKVAGNSGVLGPELVTNGDFSNGLTGWTEPQASEGTATVVAGRVQMEVEETIGSAIEQTINPVNGCIYRITFDAQMDSGAYGFLVFGTGSVPFAAGPNTFDLMYANEGTSVSAYKVIRLSAAVNVGTTTRYVYLDNISVRKLSDAPAVSDDVLPENSLDGPYADEQVGGPHYDQWAENHVAANATEHRAEVEVGEQARLAYFFSEPAQYGGVLTFTVDTDCDTVLGITASLRTGDASYSYGITEILRGAESFPDTVVNGTYTVRAYGPVNSIFFDFGVNDGTYCYISGVTFEPYANAVPETPPGNVLILPPSDGDYTLEIFGKFKTADLALDGDTNWWTENYPEYVVRAARLMLELDGHRNVSGMDAFEARIKTDIERLLANDRFAFIAGLTPQEAVLNG